MRYYILIGVVCINNAYAIPSFSLPMKAKCKYTHKDTDGFAQSSKGNVVISDSGQFKLDITNKLAILDDGIHLWIHDIPLKQVTRFGHLQVFDVIGKNFNKTIRDSYRINELKLKNSIKIVLTPRKEQKGFKQISFTICNKNELCKLSYLDSFEESHVYKFYERKKLKRNKEKFIMKIQKGVDIIYPEEL